MLKQFYKYMTALLIGGTIVGCTSDLSVENPPVEGDVPVQLNGMLRSLGDADDPGDGELITTGYPLEAYSGVKFYLSARTVDAPVSNYLLNQEIFIGAKNTTDQGRNKLDGTVYYPLGKKAINLFSYTGSTISENGNITLTSGTGINNDYLLGVGTEANGTTLKSGKSDDPVEYITYKHLMTRVDVRIEVAGDVEETKPQSVTMNFYRSGDTAPIANKGTYNIFTGGNSEGYATNSPNGHYSFSNITTTPTTHYLVPNGMNLTTYSGQIFSYLKIDDYVATTEDLVALKFSKAKLGSTGVETDFILKPGLAYDLVFKINRLKITSIEVTVKPWDVKPGDTEWGYEPKIISLSTDDYDSGDISKMLLKYEHTDGKVYQYIGKAELDGSGYNVDFVSLPPNLSTLGGKLTADLYTKDGLLAKDVTITPSGDTELAVDNLGRYGMKKRGDILEISTPLQFALMLNDAAKPDGAKYEVMRDLDMNGVSVEIVPQAFPENSVLDGKGFDILNLYITGNGLFTENKGILKHFRIASGEITGNGSGAIGAICQSNSGTIEAVVNQANVQAASGQMVAGGIAGTNEAGGTIIASVNSGNVFGDSSGAVGGIVGENKNSSGGAVTACLNTGMLDKSANVLGGIIGTSVAGTSQPVVVTGFWLTGTARKDQAVSAELAVGNNPEYAVDGESADLASSVIRSNNTIDKLNSALGSSAWKYELDENRFSWPIAVPNP